MTPAPSSSQQATPTAPSQDGHWYVAQCGIEWARRIDDSRFSVPLLAALCFVVLYGTDELNVWRALGCVLVAALSIVGVGLARRLGEIARTNAFVLRRKGGLGRFPIMLSAITVAVALFFSSLHMDILARAGSGSTLGTFSVLSLFGLGFGATRVLAPVRRVAWTFQGILFAPLVAWSLYLTFFGDEPHQAAVAAITAAAALYAGFLTLLGWRDLVSQLAMQNALMASIKEIEASRSEAARESDKALHAGRLASLGRMAGGVAHEINNPLTIVIGHMRGLASMMTGDPAAVDWSRVRHRIDRMQVAIDRVTKIVASLMILSRPENTEPLEELDLREQVVNCLAHINVPEHLRLEVDTAGEDVLVHAHRMQLTQVLNALIANAVEATDGMAQRLVRIRITVTAREGRVWIEDSGPGIPATIIDRIFDPFFTTKPVGKGVGLSLAVSKAIMLAAGGDLEYLPGRPMTTFLLKLERSVAESDGPSEGTLPYGSLLARSEAGKAAVGRKVG